MKDHSYGVIMAGGIGSRFWPMSTAEHPKQFIDILGTGKKSVTANFWPIDTVLPGWPDIYCHKRIVSLNHTWTTAFYFGRTGFMWTNEKEHCTVHCLRQLQNSGSRSGGKYYCVPIRPPDNQWDRFCICTETSSSARFNAWCLAYHWHWTQQAWHRIRIHQFRKNGRGF